MSIKHNLHYISVDSASCVTDGWSDGWRPDKDTTNAICINDKGCYHFEMLGMVNPDLFDRDGIPLYKWDGSSVIPRTPEEIEADRRARPAPPPTEQERLRADVDELAAASANQDELLVDQEYRLTCMELGV